ncbi:MAG: hypothetical protein J5636_02945 [Clostridiales bacterium]|nr:hypothetical protein [Clostridiales bacterium]
MKRIRWFLVDNKAWVIFIISLIISALILVFEIGLGLAIPVILLGVGGEMTSSITLGGNLYEHFYPLQGFGQPEAHEIITVTFFPPFFLLFYALRFIIIIPVVNLLLKDDYSRPLYSPGGVLLSDEVRSKSNKNAWTCECKKVNPAYTGTCSCGMTKKEALARQAQRQNRPAGNPKGTKKD